ncbi:exotoxin beta-grasp domain-containing protein, partial [Staphylococcus aureus]|uniref:exotoxin beta-grasp domain-containing protein n=1 Tax=Staphylococcus aureus TaxID=1280 RepID=UPI0037D9B64C
MTNKNLRSLFPFLSNPTLQLKKLHPKNPFSINHFFFIQNQQLSFNQLHFKITKLLIQKYTFYKPTSHKPTILINIKHQNNHQIHLTQKLTFQPMFHLI